MNEEQYISRRLIDLSKQAQCKGIVMFSDFLSLHEQTILQQNKEKLSSAYELSGGYEYAERQMAAFLPDALFYEWEYPMQCVRIVPTYPKFAESLTHRDVLGALMNLGIERSKLGDLLVPAADSGNTQRNADHTAERRQDQKENKDQKECSRNGRNNGGNEQQEILFFAQERIVPYMLEQLTMIRHTAVTLEIETQCQIDYTPRLEEHEAIITSNRLDAVIAAICHTSRAQSLRMIQEGKIAVNGAQSLHNTYYCKQGDILSIRGFGKVRFGELLGVTKKDRVRFSYQIFR